MSVIVSQAAYILDELRHISSSTLIGLLGFLSVIAVTLVYLGILIVAPTPRQPRPSEKQFITIGEDGIRSAPQPMPCWLDEHEARKELVLDSRLTPKEAAYKISPGEVFITVVVPAYNEEDRLNGMLEDAVGHLARTYPTAATSPIKQTAARHSESPTDTPQGWEILIVSDGSTDETVETALRFIQTHAATTEPPTPSGPWSYKESPLKRPRTDSEITRMKMPVDIPYGSIRVIQLEENRGKGGAVIHGMRHARGQYVAFADADGASRISDIGRLVARCQEAQDHLGRAVGIGSRAHLAGSEDAVKRSGLRKFLMWAFHLFLWTMTPPATAAIRDTQCGFKLFTRASLPYIVPFMHSEGWIFDVEMLMLAESAKIPMVEVAIGWKEVKGSKLNVVWDSLGMAWGLFILRAAWIVGVYKRDV